MTITPLKIAAKIIFISRQIYLNTQNREIVPYNQTKMQIQHDALFLQFSILNVSSSLDFLKLVGIRGNLSYL